MSTTANLQSRGLTVRAAARLTNVSERMVYLARKLCRTGRADLIATVERGEISVHRALLIAKGSDKTPPDGYARIVRAWNAATPSERCRFAEELIRIGVILP